MKIKFMTGEMAKLHGISKQTLQYYDRISLLKPREIDETNRYRYYTLDQFEELDVILSLKNLGMKLKEIKHYLNESSLDGRMDLLENQQTIIHEKISRLERIGHRLSSIRSSLKANMNITPFEMGIKSLDKRNIQVEDVKPPFEWYDLEIAIKKIITWEKKRKDMVGSGFMLFVEIGEDGQEIFKKVALEVDYESPEVIPGGKFAYLYHKGAYEALPTSLSRLLDYVDQSEFEVSGAVIEKTLVDIFAVPNEADLLVELQVPVLKR